MSNSGHVGPPLQLDEAIRRRGDLGVLIATAGLLAAYVFLQTVDEVVEGEADAIDRLIVNFVKSIDSPKWFDEMMRDCTAFGGFFVLSLVTLAVGVFFWVKRLRHALILLLTNVAGARSSARS